MLVHVEWVNGVGVVKGLPLYQFHILRYIYIYTHTGSQQTLLDEHSGCFDILSHLPGEETDSRKYLLVSNLVNGYWEACARTRLACLLSAVFVKISLMPKRYTVKHHFSFHIL